MATWYKINASAKLTVRADSLNVRSGHSCMTLLNR